MIALAIVLAIVASLSFALGATAQHLGVEKTVGDSGDRSLTLKRLLTLLRTPIWLGGLFLIALGAAIHIVALKLAPLTVVQPLGILAVPFSVLLAARLRKQAPTRMVWTAVAITVIGIVIFTYFSSRHVSADADLTNSTRQWTMTLVVWALAIGLGLIGRFGKSWIRCLAWAWGGAALYGIGSGYIKMLTEIVTGPSFLSHQSFWFAVVGLAASYLVGGWMIQQGYASGPAEIVVGSMTTVDPLISVLFGLYVLGEGAGLTAGPIAGMLLGGAIACGGVVLLSRHHPDAQREYGGEAVAEAAL